MGNRRTVLWTLRVGAALSSAGFGVFLLVRAWSVPLEGGAALFTPLAFVGAVVCFGLSVALLAPRQTSVPRSGRPAAR